jgi:hypothetical protein
VPLRSLAAVLAALVNGARIILIMLPGAEGPMLTYTTAEADAWERRKNDARF